MFHTPEEFAAFTDGERRFVAAAWRDDPARPYFVLPDGEAEQHRRRARTELRCMFRDCLAPEITTVARTGRRDGFRHLSGSTEGHGGPEGFHHISGKAVLVDFLRRTYPHLEVRAEQGIDTQRTRIADVMVADPATGRRMAFEVQYASLSPTDWQARTDDYAAAGIPVVWLWGHVGVHLRPAGYRVNGQPPRVELSPTLKAAAEQQPLLWLNPELGALAIGHTVEKWGAAEKPMPPSHARAELSITPLSSFTLSASGLEAPLLAAMRANREEAERQRVIQAAEDARRLATRSVMPWPPERTAKASPPTGPKRRTRLDELKARAESWASTRAHDVGVEVPLCAVCREPIDEVLVAHGGRHLLPCRPRP